MGHIETRFRVAAPPDRVFDLVVDTVRYPVWQTMLQELLGRSGPADAVGASFAGRYRVLGRNLHARFVVTSAIRPYLHELTGTTRGGWARWSTHVMAEPDDPVRLGAAGSLVRIELEYRLSGDLFGGFLALLTDPVLRREVERTYGQFRVLAEAAEAAEAAAGHAPTREQPGSRPPAS